MTFEQWTRCVKPKVQGSRNLLDNLLPADDPFFLLFSSISGIMGNGAQANYAAGNTFEDALAHYARAHRGIRTATSLDVGVVIDSGAIPGTTVDNVTDEAVQRFLAKYTHRWEGLQIVRRELRAGVKAVLRDHCRRKHSPTAASGPAIPAQIILGIADTLVREPGRVEFYNDRKFEHRVVYREKAAAAEPSDLSVIDQLKAATNLTSAVTIVEEALRRFIARAAAIEPGEVDVGETLVNFGRESLAPLLTVETPPC